MISSSGFELTVNAFGVSDVENILPPEMVEKILKLLNFKDICQAKLICRRWKEIIVKGNLLKKASGKTSTNSIYFRFFYVKP